MPVHCSVIYRSPENLCMTSELSACKEFVSVNLVSTVDEIGALSTSQMDSNRELQQKTFTVDSVFVDERLKHERWDYNAFLQSIINFTQSFWKPKGVVNWYL